MLLALGVQGGDAVEAQQAQALQHGAAIRRRSRADEADSARRCIGLNRCKGAAHQAGQVAMPLGG